MKSFLFGDPTAELQSEYISTIYICLNDRVETVVYIMINLKTEKKKNDDVNFFSFFLILTFFYLNVSISILILTASLFNMRVNTYIYIYR